MRHTFQIITEVSFYREDSTSVTEEALLRAIRHTFDQVVPGALGVNPDDGDAIGTVVRTVDLPVALTGEDDAQQE